MLFLASPAYWSSWTDKMLLVRGLSSEAKPEDLFQSVFPRAAEIVVAKNMMATFPHAPNVLKRKMKAAVARGDDG